MNVTFVTYVTGIRTEDRCFILIFTQLLGFNSHTMALFRYGFTIQKAANRIQ